jgi:ubiquinone/menaquinone biosynthesis C-methylase UbiE
MKKFYQKEWQGINFTDFTSVSLKNLPSSDFYNLFYNNFFKKYSNYDQLNSDYKYEKLLIAEWIGHLFNKGTKVLSVGCGIGFIEAYLFRKFGNKIDLHVSDFASTSLNWLSEIIPPDKMHLNGIDHNLMNFSFDVIYFSAVDYAIESDNMVEILREYKKLLSPSGTLIVISASFLHDNSTYCVLLKRFIKERLIFLINYLSLFRLNRYQFWGWMRSKSDYLELLVKSGYSVIDYGFINSKISPIFFVKSSNK